MNKKSILRMTAAAAILSGMMACGHKAEAASEAANTPEEMTTTQIQSKPVTPEEREAADKMEYTTTPSGLKYKVIRKGEGTKSPTARDYVTVNYEGTLTDGTVFDSSYKRGEPIGFMLNQVIPGWTEGVQLMNEGDVYEFYIPYQLAYGERGAGNAIPPKSDLVFVVELLKVN